MSKAVLPAGNKSKGAAPVSFEKEKLAGNRVSTAPLKITITGRACLIVYGVVLVPMVLAATLFLARREGAEAKAATAPTAAVSPVKKEMYLHPGPWGTVESVPFSLEIPEEYLSVRLDEKSDARWFFHGYTRAALTQFFAAAGLTEAERAQLTKAKWEETAGGIYVSCPTAVRLSLSPESRRQVYSVLAQYAENIWQREEARAIPADKLDEFMAGSGVSDANAAVVKKLCWRRGKLMLFSDMPAMLETIAAPKEKLALEQAFSRRPTMLLKLHITARSDVDDLMSYWGRGGMRKDLRPLLDGMAKLPEGAAVDLIHLLPPMPAAHVFTYPFPSFNQPENCHWTSFNFFRDPPEGNYSNFDDIRQKLASDYYPVFTDPRYGDLVFLMKPSGEIIHSAVFIADNVVYSKNGGHFSAPWLFMALPDLLDSYATFVGENEEVKVFYYRNKYL